MPTWFYTLLIQLDHWDSALSRRLALSQEPAAGRLRLWNAGVQLVAHLGDSWLWLAACGAMLAHARRGDPTQRKERTGVASSLAATIVATAVVVAAIKHFVKRKRPRAARLLYGAGVDAHSFPSGHAARLAAIAVWCGGVSSGGGWLMQLLAVFVGASRVQLGIHYVGDVLAGYVVGGVVAWVIRRIWRNKTAVPPI